IYDPVQQSWDTTAPMRQKRSGCTATLLKDGRVLVVGGAVWNGDDLSYLNTAEVFDPMYERWSVTGSLFFGREDHSATLLQDGKVLVAGGGTVEGNYFGEPLASTELYDPN